MERPKLDELEPYLRDGITFYDHQVAGIDWLWNRKSFLLADLPGLGKTIQSLAVCAIHAKMTKDVTGRESSFLVVCPASLKFNWADEIDKFTRVTSHMVDGSPAKRRKQIDEFYRDAGTKILIMGYETVVSHINELSKYDFDAVIADEAHYLKGPDTKRTKAFRDLKPSRRFMLTGTPILKHVDDLWTVLNEIQPGSWGSFKGFAATFCVYGGYNGKSVVGVKNEKRLMEGVSQVMLRRRTEDVLNLPPVRFNTRVVQLTSEQRSAYTKALKEMMLERGDGESDAEEIETPMVKFLRLKQICSTTATVRTDVADHSAKLDLAIEDAKIITDDGEKLVVFTSFRATLACFANRALAAIPGVPIWVLHGDVPTDQRQATVKAWGAHQGPAIIVCIIQVAGVGLNMTEASNVMFVDLDVTPANNDQAIARVHRIGATGDSIQVWTYEAVDTVDQRVNAILLSKRKTSDTIIDQRTAESVIASEMKKELSK